MSNDLNFFFRENAEDKQTEVEIVASNRFKNKEGKVVPFKFRLLDAKEINDIQNKSVKMVQKNGKMLPETNMAAMKMDSIIESIIYPNLKDVNLQNSYNAKTERELLNIMLEGRELERLGGKVLRAQGFIEDISELISDAKN